EIERRILQQAFQPKLVRQLAIARSLFMSSPLEPALATVLSYIPERGGWKRRLIAVAIFVIATLLAIMALWKAFFSYVKPGTHLVVIAKRGAPLSPNEVLADEGQEGIQRQVLGEGWHFLWPIIYETEHQPNTLIPAGKVGIVTAKGGKP